VRCEAGWTLCGDFRLSDNQSLIRSISKDVGSDNDQYPKNNCQRKKRGNQLEGAKVVLQVEEGPTWGYQIAAKSFTRFTACGVTRNCFSRWFELIFSALDP
jgi:hypothetical protein